MSNDQKPTTGICLISLLVSVVALVLSAVALFSGFLPKLADYSWPQAFVIASVFWGVLAFVYGLATLSSRGRDDY